jgi:hypothetical protein
LLLVFAVKNRATLVLGDVHLAYSISSVILFFLLE